MNKSFPKIPTKRLLVSLQLVLSLSIFSLMPKQGLAQKKQLTASNKITKVAYIDHSLLRREYRAFADTMQKMSSDNNSKKKSYDESLSALEMQTNIQLRADSLSGGINHEKIIALALDKRNEIITTYQADLKKRTQDRARFMHVHEQKLGLADESIILERG